MRVRAVRHHTRRWYPRTPLRHGDARLAVWIAAAVGYRFRILLCHSIAAGECTIGWSHDVRGARTCGVSEGGQATGGSLHAYTHIRITYCILRHYRRYYHTSSAEHNW